MSGNIRSIKSRIKSVKTTQKITRAMKLVAVSKLRKAQEMARNADEFIKEYDHILGLLPYSIRDSKSKYILNKNTDVKKIAVLAISADKGLCGSLNSFLIKALIKFVNEKKNENKEISIYTIGKKVTNFVKNPKSGFSELLIDGKSDFFSGDLKKKSLEVSNELIKNYEDKQFDELYVMYSHFNSAISYDTKVYRLLPFDLSINNIDNSTDKKQSGFYFEEGMDIALDHILSEIAKSKIYMNIVHNNAAEIGSRMVAMGNATDNAQEVIKNLTIQFNKLRQATITQQISEIVGAAEGMKK